MTLFRRKDRGWSNDDILGKFIQWLYFEEFNLQVLDPGDVGIFRTLTDRWISSLEYPFDYDRRIESGGFELLMGRLDSPFERLSS